MALVMWKKLRARELKAHCSNYWLGCSTCKVMDGHEEEFGAFKKIPDLKFPPPIGMQVHGYAFLTEAPHGNTVFPVFGHTQTKTRKSWQSVFFHINAKNLADDGWDQLFLLVFCRKLLWKWRIFWPCKFCWGLFFISWCRCWACNTFHGNWGPLNKVCDFLNGTVKLFNMTDLNMLKIY